MVAPNRHWAMPKLRQRSWSILDCMLNPLIERYSGDHRKDLQARTRHCAELLDEIFNGRAYNGESPNEAINVWELGLLQRELDHTCNLLLSDHAPALVFLSGSVDNLQKWRTQIREATKSFDRINTDEEYSKHPLYRCICSIRAWVRGIADAQAQTVEYDVFLSYCSSDSQEASQIHEDLQSAGLKVFIAPKALQAGEDFADGIRSALLKARELWMLVTPSSLRSEWVTTEWGAAWALGKPIIPILHRCAPQDLPERLRRIHAVDFCRFPELIRTRIASD